MVTVFNISGIADVFCRGTTYVNDILESIDEEFLGLKGVHITDKWIRTDEQLGFLRRLAKAGFRANVHKWVFAQDELGYLGYQLKLKSFCNSCNEQHVTLIISISISFKGLIWSIAMESYTTKTVFDLLLEEWNGIWIWNTMNVGYKTKMNRENRN